MTMVTDYEPAADWWEFLYCSQGLSSEDSWGPRSSSDSGERRTKRNTLDNRESGRSLSGGS